MLPGEPALGCIFPALSLFFLAATAAPPAMLSVKRGAVMGSCAAQTFSGISAGQFACLLKKVSDSGVSVSGNSGSASKDGITISWEFDPVSSTLQIQCTSAPFFVSCGMINSKIHDFVDECSAVQGS